MLIEFRHKSYFIVKNVYVNTGSISIASLWYPCGTAIWHEQSFKVISEEQGIISPSPKHEAAIQNFSLEILHTEWGSKAAASVRRWRKLFIWQNCSAGRQIVLTSAATGSQHAEIRQWQGLTNFRVVFASSSKYQLLQVWNRPKAMCAS